MKVLLFTLMLPILSSLNAKDYIFESNNSNTVLNTIKYPDGKEYIHLENSGLWKDNNGDFGNEKCVGFIKKNKEQSQVEVRCEHTNQNDEKFWTLKSRNSELHDSGGGINTYIAGTGKYQKLVGKKCPYGVQYIENMVWYTQKCRF
tara:strand:+ start:305 stop:742 length:438 start_codon:yes stop_codon:yes gene_type:complete